MSVGTAIIPEQTCLDCRTAIVPEEHLGLVRMVVSKYVPKGTPLEDSEDYADGCIALLAAAEGFDPDRDLEFSTYAIACIKRALIQKWRRNKRKKRDGVVCSLGDRSVIAPTDTGNYEFLMSLFDDHPDDTTEDRRNKKVLYDHFIHEMTWQEIGEQMETRYGGERPVSKVWARQCGEAAIKLIRERFNIEDFSTLEEILA